jgi:hypothetical protein
MLECPDIVSRSEWGAESPSDTLKQLSRPVANAYFTHTAGRSCGNSTVCKADTKEIQRLHMQQNKYSDIAYNFLIGGVDGTVIEGRGWLSRGSFRVLYNNNSIGIAFMGYFLNEKQFPSKAALRSADALVACAIAKGHLQSNYTLKSDNMNSKVIGALKPAQTDRNGMETVDNSSSIQIPLLSGLAAFVLILGAFLGIFLYFRRKSRKQSEKEPTIWSSFAPQIVVVHPDQFMKECIIKPSLSSEEQTSFAFFEQYVRSVSVTELQELLRFIIGFNQLPPDQKIQVHFFPDSKGRLPYAKTCDRSINLPTHYKKDQYSKFASDLQQSVKNFDDGVVVS